MPEGLSPLTSDNRSLAERSHDVIQERILSGYFKPGEWLRQEDLSQQLAVSHTPVREALDRLVYDGLAERVPNRGVRVARINEEEIAETYFLRLLLEPIVVRLAIDNMPSRQLERLEKIINQAELLTSLDEMQSRRHINRDFHSTISKACGDGTLKRLHEIIWKRFPHWMLYEGLHRQLASVEERFQREIEEHRTLLAALSDRDLERASQIARHHIQGTKQDLIDVFEISNHIIEEKRRLMGFHS